MSPFKGKGKLTTLVKTISFLSGKCLRVQPLEKKKTTIFYVLFYFLYSGEIRLKTWLFFVLASKDSGWPFRPCGSLICIWQTGALPTSHCIHSIHRCTFLSHSQSSAMQCCL